MIKVGEVDIEVIRKLLYGLESEVVSRVEARLGNLTISAYRVGTEQIRIDIVEER